MKYNVYNLVGNRTWKFSHTTEITSDLFGAFTGSLLRHKVDAQVALSLTHAKAFNDAILLGNELSGQFNPLYKFVPVQE